MAGKAGPALERVVIPRAVFDCMVFVQALANDKGPSFACLELARSGKLELCVSLDVVAEVREVLNRPKIQKKLPAITPERIASFLRDVVSFASVIADVPHEFSYERDPKDEPYINLAIAAHAQFLASRDNDLLDLPSDAGFRERFPELVILDPVALLRKMTATGGEGET